MDPDVDAAEREHRDTTERERDLARFAETHDRVASTAQLRGLGFSAGEVSHRVRQRRLTKLSRGVYAIGPGLLTDDGRRRAALLAGGEGAVLFGRSAAALHAVRPDNRAVVEIATPKQRRSRPGVVVHEVVLDPPDVTEVDGFAATSLARTFVDLAVTHPQHITRAFIRAEQRQTFDLFALEELFARRPLLRGIPAVRRALAEHHPLGHRTRSMPELAYLLAVTKAGLPAPRVNELVCGEEVDFHWPGLRLVVEVDGPHHDTAWQQARDQARDALLRAHGWVVARFRADDVRRDPGRAIAETRRVISVLRAAA